MAPIHDTDVAEERWQQEQWRTFELWEKIALRLRKKKRLWVVLAVVVFLGISAIPPIQDRMPYWSARRHAVGVGLLINELKILAATEHRSFELVFSSPGTLRYQILKREYCSSTVGEIVREGVLSTLSEPEHAIITRTQAQSFGIPGVIERLCVSPLSGAKFERSEKGLAGFAVAPIADLSSGRSDRVAVLLVQGEGAETTF
jgi:hypothetical protein